MQILNSALREVSPRRERDAEPRRVGDNDLGDRRRRLLFSFGLATGGDQLRRLIFSRAPVIAVAGVRFWGAIVTRLPSRGPAIWLLARAAILHRLPP